MNLLEIEQVSTSPKYNPSMMSRCLIVCDDYGGRGIFCVGYDLWKEICDVGSFDADDLGLTPPDDGVWVWEGIYERKLSNCWDDAVMDSEPDGEFRRPSETEWSLIQSGSAPWGEQDWLISE